MNLGASVRRELGIRTIFNLIGPLANPAPLTCQLVGVSEERLMRPVAEALRSLGIRHGMVVHGLDGLDEVTTTDATRILELLPGALETSTLRPEEFGYSRVSLEALRGGDVPANAQIAREVLSGRPSPQSDIVALNAGCAIYVADQARSLQEGVARAEAVLRAGRALALLERVVRCSHTC